MRLTTSRRISVLANLRALQVGAGELAEPLPANDAEQKDYAAAAHGVGVELTDAMSATNRTVALGAFCTLTAGVEGVDKAAGGIHQTRLAVLCPECPVKDLCKSPYNASQRTPQTALPPNPAVQALVRDMFRPK
jgi:hypothetical protein